MKVDSPANRRLQWLAIPFLLWQAIAPLRLPAQAADRHAGESFSWQQYARPEEAGWSSELLEKARLEAEGLGSTAVMLLCRGRVVAAWGDISRRCICHSVRKSLLSALIGIQVQEGRLELGKTMNELGIDDLQPLSKSEKRASVCDLLLARSGIYHPAAKETREMRKTRPARRSHEPGTFWHYNNWDFNVLGVIFERQTGGTIAGEFQKRIAMPLQMRDFRTRDVFNQFERNLSRHPAYVFRMSARDLARFGQLYLQGGVWQGQEIIPAAWIRESCWPFSKVRPGVGYGYMWWVFRQADLDVPGPNPFLNRNNRFAALGLGGQMVLVVPALDLVMVHLVDTEVGSGVASSRLWEFVEKVLEARIGGMPIDPELASVSPRPLAGVKPPAPEHREIKIDAGKMARLAGLFQLEKARFIRLRLYGSQLTAIYEGQETDLFPTSETFFFARTAPMQISFHRDSGGRITGLSLIVRGRARRAKRV